MVTKLILSYNNISPSYVAAFTCNIHSTLSASSPVTRHVVYLANFAEETHAHAQTMKINARGQNV